MSKRLCPVKALYKIWYRHQVIWFIVAFGSKRVGVLGLKKFGVLWVIGQCIIGGKTIPFMFFMT